VIERGVVLSRGSVLSLDRDLLPVLEARTGQNSPADGTGKTGIGKLADEPTSHHSLEEVERGHILRVLESTGGIIDGARGAAHVLKLHPSTLRARMKKLRIERPPATKC
jgi:formate hydrogenlyase transcriptional activator